MPEATPFTFFGSISDTDPDAVLLTGFPFKLDKVDVSSYDWWTTLGGVNNSSPTTSDALIAESLENAMKLFWNYNGHTVDFPLSFNEATLTIDIEQGEFDSGSRPAPFEPKSRVCRTNGWFFNLSEDPEFGDQFIDVRIDPIRMYNGSTDDEDNFVGYGMDRGSSPFGHEVFFADDADDFFFSSYLNEDGSASEAYEYSDAIDGMWFVAAAEGGFVGSATPTINGLSADFFDSGGVPTGTITYQGFDFWTYPV